MIQYRVQPAHTYVCKTVRLEESDSIIQTQKKTEEISYT